MFITLAFVYQVCQPVGRRSRLHVPVRVRLLTRPATSQLLLVLRIGTEQAINISVVPYLPNNLVPYLVPNLVPYLVPNLVTHLLPDLVPYLLADLVPYLLPNLIPYLVP